jgi:hypothetical protein
MTVPTTTGASRYTGNGATSTYNVGFHFQANADLEVIVTTTADVDTTLTLNTHYTVTGAGDQSGGQITLLGAYANLTTDYILTILLKPALNNSTSFINSGKVSNAQLQTLADRMSQRDIELQTQIDRCIKIPVKETPTSTNTTIPDSTDRSSRTFTWGASGAPSATSSVDVGSVTMSALGETIAEAANAGAVLDALGVTAFAQTILDDTTAGGVLTTLGVTATGQDILDSANVAAARTAIGLDGASGAITSLDIADAATAQIFQARLTLTSATAVTINDVTAAGTIYLTPYKGNKVSVYTGTRWKLMPLTEISLALTATSGKPYDVWVYDNSGTLTLETTVWTDTTTRATALAIQDGVYCKTGALTRRYVGTFYASGANQTQDAVSGRHVWNFYNRVPRLMYKSIAPGTVWTYTSATIRQANGDATNQLDFVIGVQEDSVEADLVTHSSNSSVDIGRRAYICRDATDGVPSEGLTLIMGASSTKIPADTTVPHYCKYRFPVAAGRHFLAWVEMSEASGSTIWGEDDGYSLIGLNGTVLA